jgi:hypothetical protein
MWGPKTIGFVEKYGSALSGVVCVLSGPSLRPSFVRGILGIGMEQERNNATVGQWVRWLSNSILSTMSLYPASILNSFL